MVIWIKEKKGMSMQTFHWEHPLLALAHQALENTFDEENPSPANRVMLEVAYSVCDDLTLQHSRTFYLASSLLPPEKRRATRALYAFCRVSDDLVDRSRGNAASELEHWRLQLLGAGPIHPDPVSLAWRDTRLRFGVPWLYAEQLIDGVATDLYQNRYATFGELASYCYGVACTVGLMSMHITGFSGPEAIPYAIRLGVALQLTNILRDVGKTGERVEYTAAR
jgi:phytoene synthase